jgi:membrane protease YdiL (CAAX protease family)
VLTAALWGVGGFFVMLVAYSAVFGIESGLMPRLHAPVRYEGDTLYWGVGLTAEVDRLLRALAIFGSYALAIPAAAALVNRRPMRSWITAAARFRWRLLLAGLVLFGAAVAVGVLVQGAATGWPEYPPLLDRREALPVRLIYLGAAVVVIPVVVMAEEVLTRGWLLQLTSAFTRNLLVILAVNAVVFSILHFDPNPFANVGHFYTGVVLGYMVLRLGGLEFAIGVHAANILVVRGRVGFARVRPVDHHRGIGADRACGALGAAAPLDRRRADARFARAAPARATGFRLSRLSRRGARLAPGGARTGADARTSPRVAGGRAWGRRGRLGAPSSRTVWSLRRRGGPSTRTAWSLRRLDALSSRTVWSLRRRGGPSTRTAWRLRPGGPSA